MMKLTAKEKRQLQQMIGKTDSSALAVTRGKLILLLAEGKTPQEIARLLKVSLPTVYTWKKKYLEQGVACLSAGSPGRKAISESRVRKLLEEVAIRSASGKPWTVRELAQRHGLSVGIVSRILKENPQPSKTRNSDVETPRPVVKEDVPLAGVVMEDIARATGFSKQTVSMALRDSPRISLETRRKICEAADRMNYRPNPLTAALMANIRRNKPSSGETVLMMLHDLDVSLERHAADESLTQVVFYYAAKRQAERLGYRLDTLNYAAKGMTGRRLDGILKARGTRGLYITGTTPFPELDWSRYALVCSREPFIPCYYVLVDWDYHLQLAVEKIMEMNYCRIGLVLDPMYPASGACYSAFHGYLYYIRHHNRMPEPFDCGGPDTTARFDEWLRREKPDVVLAPWTGSLFCQRLEEHLRNMPTQIGLVALGIPPHKKYLTGVDICLGACAGQAVSLLHEQLINNRFGLLKTAARRLLVRGKWNEGLPVCR